MKLLSRIKESPGVSNYEVLNGMLNRFAELRTDGDFYEICPEQLNSIIENYEAMKLRQVFHSMMKEANK